MADSELSASELRQRYHKGGSVADDELTAAQLRARHGIAPNKKDFSTSAKGTGVPVVAVVAIVIIVAVVGFVVFFGQ